MSTAIVLAGPERKRILRELLSVSEPWPASHRKLYAEMVRLESMATADVCDEEIAEKLGAEAFGRLIIEGVPADQAREAADSAAREAVRNLQRPSQGRQERERRRTFREAVTAGDGALAVTTGLVETCIVCGGPFPPHCRSDAAYCSSACRTAAYRKRRMAPRKPISAAEKAARDAERQMMEKAARGAGLLRQNIRECIRVANLPEEEFEELLEYQPQHSATKILRAIQAAKRRQAAGGPTKQPEPRRGTK